MDERREPDSVRFGVGRRVMIEPDRPNSPMHGPATITASIPVRDLVNDRDDVKIDARNDATGKYVAIGALVKREGRAIVALDERGRFAIGVGDRVRSYASTPGYPVECEGIVVAVNGDTPEGNYAVYDAERGIVRAYENADLTVVERAHYASPSLDMVAVDEKTKNDLDFAARVLEDIAHDGEYVLGADERSETFGEVATTIREGLLSQTDIEREGVGLRPPGPGDDIVHARVSERYDIREFDMKRVSGSLIEVSDSALYVLAGRDVAVRVEFAKLDGPMSYTNITERTVPGQTVVLHREDRGVRVELMHQRERIAGEVER